MNAPTLHCESCGAAASPESPVCAHCGARLATVACPGCLAMMYRGMSFCPHCGAPAAQWEDEPGHELPCPSCQQPMLRGTLGQVRLHECPSCFGIWLAPEMFDFLCRQAQKEQSPPGMGAARAVNTLDPVRYRRCPVCAEIMSRFNFARCSGVVIDACKPHGSWFDAEELRRILEFVRHGGLARMDQIRKLEADFERRHAQAMGERPGSYSLEPETSTWLSVAVSAAGDLIDILT